MGSSHIQFKFTMETANNEIQKKRLFEIPGDRKTARTIGRITGKQKRRWL